MPAKSLLFLLAIVGVPSSAVVGEETDHHHFLRHSHNGRQNAENPSNPNPTRKLNTGVLREGQFAPLSCNDNLTVEDCSSTITLSSILNSAPEGSEVLVECGTCAMVDETDGSTLVFPSGLNIEGMLYFPSSAKVTLELDHLFVQGTLKMDAPLVGNSVTFFMTGTEDRSLYPHPDNSAACDPVDGCSMGKRAIAVAGGTLDISGLSDDKPCPSWTRLSIPSLDYSAIEVGQEAAECWEEIIDSIEDPAEILITNSEKIKGWNEHHIHQVSSIDTETGTLYLTTPVEGNPVTTEINKMYAAEVALLNRRILFDSITDGIDDLHGGHLIINRTPGVAQKLEGVEVRNFGQQGILGRYPIHFHMSDSVSGSSVRKNVIRQSNQRCVVIHGSNEIMVENNVAYDTHGHCYILEDGGEMENTFKDNLGAMTRRQKHGIGSTDGKAATFWVTNTKNHYIGNTAAGSAFSGFWFETLAIRGDSAKLDDNKGIYPKFLPMYTFKDNTSHSNARFGLHTYDKGYRGSGTMTNTKLYKNGIGLFFHGTSGIIFDGGLIADNAGIGIFNFDNFPPGNRMENTKIIGTSAMYRDSVCPGGRTGMLFSLNARNEQLVLRNTTFEGFSYDSGIACGENTNLVLKLYGGFNTYPYHMPVFESDVTFDSNKNVFDITHDFFPPYKPWNTFLEDPNGSMNPTGLPGFFVQDAPRMTTFVEDGACSEVARDGSFARFCKETCMRRVHIRTGCCGEREAYRQLDPDYSLVVTSVTDPTKSFEFPKYTHKAGKWFFNDNFDFVLPGGKYTLEFINPDGETEVPPKVEIKFDTLLPACDGYVTKASFEIIMPKYPTMSPDAKPEFPILSRISASQYSTQEGVQFGTSHMDSFDNNDYVTYSKVDFGEPGTTKGILLEYAKGNDNGRVEIRTGGPKGYIIAEFSPAKTGGWSNFITAYIGINDVDGLHDVTFVAKDTSGVLNLAWFELSDFSDRANEYSRISASQYSTQKGVQFGTSQTMGYFDKNDYVTYSHVNFGEPGATDGIRLSYAKANDGGRVEVRLGGPTGTLLTEFQPVHTGGWGKYMEAYLGIEGVSGVHDITFVGKDVGGVMNLAWFEPSLRNELHPKVAATAYSSKAGHIRSNTQYITYFHNNDSITYSNLNFGSDGATRSLRVTYAKANNGGRVEVRAGGQTGALIGTFSPQNTGGWSTSVTADIPLDAVEGISDLTFVGKDVDGGVWNLESFELSSATPSPTLAPLTYGDLTQVGKVAIRSVSSRNYLDGRIGNIREVWMTNRNPVGDKYLHWTIEKVDGNYAIKSVSSGNYLDGRNSSYEGKNGAVWVTNRNPKGDVYLQWKIESVDGNFALKSVSSGLYLDGRAPQHLGNQVWLNGSQPQGNHYLQWTFSSQK